MFGPSGFQTCPTVLNVLATQQTQCHFSHTAILVHKIILCGESASQCSVSAALLWILIHKVLCGGWGRQGAWGSRHAGLAVARRLLGECSAIARRLLGDCTVVAWPLAQMPDSAFLAGLLCRCSNPHSRVHSGLKRRRKRLQVTPPPPSIGLEAALRGSSVRNVVQVTTGVLLLLGYFCDHQPRGKGGGGIDQTTNQ